MALEPASSRLTALRSKYSLMIGRAAPPELPEKLREYYREPWDIEVRVLYAEGAESRRQWIFLDEGRVTRLVAVFVDPPPEDEEAAEEGALPPDDPAGGAEESAAEGGEPVPSGFIEFYDGDGLLTEERRFQDDGGETGVSYFYRRQILIRAETTRKSPPVSEAEVLPEGEGAGEEAAAGPENPAAVSPDPEPEPDQEPESEPEPEPEERLVCTDYYRYSRSGSLRAIERVYHEPLEGDPMTRLRFPHRILDSVYEREFVNPALAYGSESLADIFMDPAYRVVYNTDQRGRILSETRMDSEGQVVGELTNIWAGDRLAQVIWKAGEDERRVEYRYNADGDRIEERNYRKENLERRVLREGDIEVEELYMDGQLMLRARWENGRKISEERIRSSASGKAP
jgi:hypothetical protein